MFVAGGVLKESPTLPLPLSPSKKKIHTPTKVCEFALNLMENKILNAKMKVLYPESHDMTIFGNDLVYSLCGSQQCEFLCQAHL